MRTYKLDTTHDIVYQRVRVCHPSNRRKNKQQQDFFLMFGIRVAAAYHTRRERKMPAVFFGLCPYSKAQEFKTESVVMPTKVMIGDGDDEKSRAIVPVYGPDAVRIENGVGG